jgi:hypothetical protein
MRADQRGALDGHQGSRIIRARAAAQVSLPLGAANDEQQLEVEAPSAGHRAPPAPRLAGVVALRLACPLDPVVDRGVEGWLAGRPLPWRGPSAAAANLRRA